MSGYLPSGPGVSTNSRSFAVLPLTCCLLHLAEHASRNRTTLIYNFPLFLLFSSSTSFLKFFLNILPVGLRNQLFA
jgi:hypothetical protein